MDFGGRLCCQYSGLSKVAFLAFLSNAIVLLLMPECSVCPECPGCKVCDGYVGWGSKPGVTTYPVEETMWLDVDGFAVCRTDCAVEDEEPEMEMAPANPFLSPGLRNVFRYSGSLMYSSSPWADWPIGAAAAPAMCKVWQLAPSITTWASPFLRRVTKGFSSTGWR